MSHTSRNTAQERKATYKTPPATVRNASTSQEARRQKALEEQKRRRAERFDSSRQLDFFADLTLGRSDDDDEGTEPAEPVREGVAQFATLLPPAAAGPSQPPTTADGTPRPMQDDALPAAFGTTKKKGKHNKKRRGGASKGQPTKPNSKWADKCMYAELLEITEDTEMSEWSTSQRADGIPQDIQSGWVAMTPVPAGKRCLAITHAPSGIAGLVSNTTLRSRLLGKCLMKPFPSSLPSHTVLDCILDEDWRDNGILHILDVVKWKGQDIADCETPFRFWWRDTRLSELASLPPPSIKPEPSASQYHFAYPTTLLPIPYHTNLSLDHLLNSLIPTTRVARTISISVPNYTSMSQELSGMDIDASATVELKTEDMVVKSDGILLYVAQATYEPGTSPLSLWVPVRAYIQDEVTGHPQSIDTAEGPLDVFERYVPLSGIFSGT
ncbi:uncharacterized protein PHACADRAFT_141835 [Phanerochaete carnosa HHB-10118-sp]|uniref:Snurportin-1 n=1 Tax=Phanerochaete carnosa (strain HHB-10118-sp) TaxID=650164 RepID=K5X267_PHACS|nr:uncharacterized protein PHACADRAFT_141835 [Phanerochaete carnosa HHB-10118-sp]EKM56857.1 hypothetical protein PHACADRAFT_141835 [Phanerochaete carnosa HHB-10118-sp]